MKKFIIFCLVSVIMFPLTWSVSAVVSDPTTTPTATPTSVPTTIAPTAQPRTTTSQANARAAALTRAKDAATALFNNHFIAKLTAQEDKVNANSMLGADAKAQLLKKLGEEKSWFTAQRDSIAAQTSIEAVRTIVKTARERYAESVKAVYLLHVGAGYVNALEKVIKNFEENILAKFVDKIAVLESKGVDVTAEKALLAKATTEVSTAKGKISEIRNSTTIDQAKTAFNAAKTSLQSARTLLREILSTLKSKVTQVSVSASPTAAN